ncbi:ABC transporter ATP-binding protein [Gandjariella thermophila]|uniref:Putative nitrate ABC transporter, ATP-binding protein n=1 Tax=Gandjariella thermophila TaxID=1931992 RepID=A0A4D4J521_9PSEU|nr:ABC transporter ATP-binding protein [Gandjariella thermophila]GDY29063.1 putative nitrate ABC transporter, ATP-binding protein [Gandjariella thermophila]
MTVTSEPVASGLRLDGVRAGYHDADVLSGLDLDARPGEFLVLAGPSGCGKSTLLRSVSGLHPVRSGRVLVDGQPVRGTSADRALVFQEDGLLPWRSVLRNVELPLAVQRIPRAERRERAAHWIDRVGLAGYERYLPRQLSGGMRQRAQLARTLAANPRIILMDEPFAALDVRTRASMRALLVDVWRANPTTVLFVTHDVDEALALADRVAVLDRGGRIAALVDVPHPRPADPSTADNAAAKARLLAALTEEGA